MTTHTISVRLENKPGALARVSQLFSRRGYNIQSLAVGPTERADISRLTLRVDCSEHSLEQIEKQMHKLVNVLRVVELRPGSSSAAAAEEAGLPVKTVAEAVEGAQVVSLLVPDGPQAQIFRDEVAPNISPGAAAVDVIEAPDEEEVLR